MRKFVLHRRNALKTIAASACLLSAGAIFTACSSSKPQFRNVDITGADYAQNFALVDFNGKPRTLADFKGKVVVLFFGFTQCPDVCPTTMSELAQIKQSLGADGDKVQGLFVSIDPERDTPEVLRAYMTGFDPSFLGLYAGSPEQLAELARKFKIYYKRVDGKTPGSYTMDHTAASYVYDPQGNLRLYTRYGSGTEALAGDIKLLLQGA